MYDNFVNKSDFRVWFVDVYGVITTSRPLFIHAIIDFCNLQHIYILKSNDGNLYHLHHSEFP